MATTRVQKECELWIANHWLPNNHGQAFSEQRIQMQDRGSFDFDVVSQDGAIIGNISTATARTYRGQIASGKKSKLRADCLMLSLVKAQLKLMLLTEECMYDFAIHEQKNGRLPLDVQLVHVSLPHELSIRLATARNTASEEVRGRSA